MGVRRWAVATCQRAMAEVRTSGCSHIRLYLCVTTVYVLLWLEGCGVPRDAALSLDLRMRW